MNLFYLILITAIAGAAGESDFVFYGLLFGSLL
jgi:hypothetical protein